MLLSEFDYPLPEELIAQNPLDRRDGSRLLVVYKDTGRVEHRMFREIGSFLAAQDLMVFNDSKVIRARLLGNRSTGGRVEIFIIKRSLENRFICLVKATSSKKVGMEFLINGKIPGKIVSQISDSMNFEVEFEKMNHLEAEEMFSREGHIPLPPYIKRDDLSSDSERYQTVYAKNLGSVAAPTAGLHYTKEVLDDLEKRKIERCFVNLCVGLGTFQPVKADDIRNHRMHEESFLVSEEVESLVKQKVADSKRVVAVGTTSLRALESAARGKEETTDLYLYPGEKFYWINALQTNFHQPKSSLLILLAAFMGKELMEHVYLEAIKEKYRFLSYGDTMLVL